MRRRGVTTRRFLLSTVAVALAAGCDMPKTKAPAKSTAAKSSASVKASDANEADADSKTKTAMGAPTLGDYSPKLDRGRLEVAQPAGWQVPPRDAKYLIRFQLDEGSAYPTIIVRAEDEANLPDVTSENVEKFAAHIREETSGKKLQSPVKVTKLGPHSGVTYVGPSVTVKGSSLPLDQLFFITASGGRRYIVELRTRQGEVEDHRAHTALVASSLKFYPFDASSEPAAAAGGNVAVQPAAETRTHTLDEKIPIPGLSPDTEKGLGIGGLSPPMPDVPKPAAGEMPKSGDGKELPAAPNAVPEMKPDETTSTDPKPAEPKPLGEKIPIPGLPPG